MCRLTRARAFGLRLLVYEDTADWRARMTRIHEGLLADVRAYRNVCSLSSGSGRVFPSSFAPHVTPKMGARERPT